MKIIRSAVGVLTLGAGFGAALSLVKDVSSPGGMIGRRSVDAGWVWVGKAAEVVSLLLDVGWAWAALAVTVGWLVGGLIRGASTGVLALIAATAAYYCVESAFTGVPLAWQWRLMLSWWLASMLFGPILGAVGASIGRPGVIGLLARLTVPVGAIVEMTFLPPQIFLIGRPTASWALVIVWTAAAASIGVILIRFLAAVRRRDLGINTQESQAQRVL
ncbi:hypothetical protein ABT061_32190 [Streptosporangium sp. NPDC002544]|uniref:hypothetical protein n=1 Tax=Streptosporangium sp. NPDC002544 TaxID=3154538 RepID=UPI00332BA72F